MRLTLSISFLLLAVFLLPAFSSPESGPLPRSSSGLAGLQADSLADVRTFYVDYCATCHGDKWEGGLAASLADGQWQYGEGDADMARVIREGIDDEGMPGWKDIMSDDQILRMVQLIRAMERDRGR